MGIVATIFFGILDYMYRKVQLNHVERASKIQKHLQKEYLTDNIEIDIQKPFGRYQKNFLKDNSTILIFHISMMLILIFAFLNFSFIN